MLIPFFTGLLGQVITVVSYYTYFGVFGILRVVISNTE